jgi:hypothetical protein
VVTAFLGISNNYSRFPGSKVQVKGDWMAAGELCDRCWEENWGDRVAQISSQELSQKIREI